MKVLFIWRAISNLLPAAERPYRKNVQEYPTCERCWNRLENVYHALIRCKQARKVRKLSGYTNLVQQTHNEEIWDVFQNAMVSVTKTEFELLSVSMWAIWTCKE